MTNPFTNRKKVRGWKRRLRQLAQLRDHNMALDVDDLARGGVHYVKMWLDPWYRLEPRNPPVWYRREVLKAFEEIYDSWHSALKAQGEPFYLRLWLFDPEFTQTQVVAAMGDRIDWYEGRFQEDDSLGPVPPPEYGAGDFDLGAFQWTPRMHDVYTTWQESECTPEEWARMHAEAIAVEELSGCEVGFRFRLGGVWLGRKD